MRSRFLPLPQIKDQPKADKKLLGEIYGMRSRFWVAHGAFWRSNLVALCPHCHLELHSGENVTVWNDKERVIALLKFVNKLFLIKFFDVFNSYSRIKGFWGKSFDIDSCNRQWAIIYKHLAFKSTPKLWNKSKFSIF